MTATKKAVPDWKAKSVRALAKTNIDSPLVANIQQSQVAHDPQAHDSPPAEASWTAAIIMGSVTKKGTLACNFLYYKPIIRMYYRVVGSKSKAAGHNAACSMATFLSIAFEYKERRPLTADVTVTGGVHKDRMMTFLDNSKEMNKLREELLGQITDKKAQASINAAVDKSIAANLAQSTQIWKTYEDMFNWATANPEAEGAE